MKRALSILTLFTVLAFQGCASPSKRIAKEAHDTGQNAREVESAALEGQKVLHDPPPDIGESPNFPAWAGQINSYFLGIVKNAQKINASAAVTAEKVADVEDTIPWWARLLKAGFIAVIVLGLIGLLLQSGLGSFLKAIFNRMGLFISTATKAKAKLESEALAANPDDVKLNAAVAINRVKDPGYNREFTKVHPLSKAAAK